MTILLPLSFRYLAKMYRKFILRKISWILLLILLSACSEKTSLQILRPAEIDTSDIQRIAIGVFEVGVIQKILLLKEGGIGPRNQQI